MKTIRRARFILLILALAAVGMAQEQPQTQAPKFFFVLLKRPANAPQMTAEAAEKLQEAHLANMRKLHTEDKLAIAGPFLDDTVLRGIFVFKSDSRAQAEEWAKTDPAIQAGRLEAEIHGPWMIDPAAVHNPPPSNGLEKYTLVLLNAGANWNPQSPVFTEDLGKHHAFVRTLFDEGKLALHGPLPLEEPGDLRGVAVFRVGPEETAKLLAADPAVKAGLVKGEIHPWGTGTGVLASGQPLK